MANSSMNRRSIAAWLLGGLLLVAAWVGASDPAAAFGMFGFGGMRGGGFVGPRPGPAPGGGQWGRMPPPHFGVPPVVRVPSGPPAVGGGPPAGGNGNSGGNGGGGGAATAQSNTTFVPDEVITAFAPGTTPQAISRVAQRYGLTQLETQNFPLIGTSLYSWRIGGGRSVPTVVRALGSENIVASVQPNYLFTLQDDAAKPSAVKPSAVKPSAATPSAGPQYVLEKLQVAQAQQIATGKNVLVAVIDSSIDMTLPELDGAIAKSFDAVAGDGHPHDHGTSIAGAIAAHGKLIGIAPGARILAVHAFDDSAGLARGTSFAIDKGLQWAADNGAGIVNMSFAGPADPLMRRLLAAAYGKGMVLIAAAGNGGPKSDPPDPGADAHVIAVTATDSNDGLFAMANRGRYIAVAAPGVDILALAPDGKVQFANGTSIAAAHVSGIAALLLERQPALKPAEIRAALMSTAKPLGPAGPNADFGAGLVNAFAALNAIDRKPADAPAGDAQAKQ
jgi:hypothetical protein